MLNVVQLNRQPAGEVIGRDQSPCLFELVERVGAAYALKIHDVVLTEDFDASVASVRRFGMAALARNYLQIGIPLMLALSPKELEVVLGTKEHSDADLKDALNTLAATRKYQETFWNSIDEMKFEITAAPPDVYTRLFDGLRQSESAAEFFLGSQLSVLLTRLSVSWQKRNEASWAQQHKAICSDRGMYAAAKADGKDAALNLQIGRRLVEAGLDLGIGYIEKAIAIDQMYAVSAYNFLADFYSKALNAEKSLHYRNKALDAIVNAEMAQFEREDVDLADTVLPHALPPEIVARLKNLCASEPAIQQAFLSRKQVKHFNEEPYYFLALVPKCDEDDQIGDDESLLLQTVCPAFDQLNIDAEFFIGVLYEDDIVLKEKLLKVPGALIYQDL